MQMRRDNKHNPYKYLSNTSGGVQASASPLKSFLFLFYSRQDIVCLCIHWVVQNTEQHPFLIHAGSFYTMCVIFLFFLSPAVHTSMKTAGSACSYLIRPAPLKPDHCVSKVRIDTCKAIMDARLIFV
jgi:hypothetical protein